MRNLFTFLFVGLFVSGCYDMHGRFVPVMPTGDAGPAIVSDAGPMVVTPDAGPITPDSGPVLADAGSDAFVPPMEDAGPPLPAGEPIVELFGPVSDELVVGVQRVRFRIRSSGAPIGAKRVHIGLPVHPYNEDAPMREGWNWERRFQIGWDSITVERDGVVADDIVTYHWMAPATPFSHAIVLVFLDEEIADTDGHEYTVLVPVTGDLEPGDRIGFDINTSRGGGVEPPVIGSLTPDGTTFGPYGWRAPHLWTRGGSCEGLHAYSEGVSPGLFVWSDRTAPDHNDADCLTGGSADWLDGTAMQMGGGYDLTAPSVAPAICRAVDVPADGSGRVIVRVEGGGDMTVPPETDFVAFSVTIENHTLGSITAATDPHNWTLSSDCTVPGPGVHLDNLCDPTNGFRIAMCFGATCGTGCAVYGAVFASGTSTRFTLFAHSRAAGTFGLELGYSTRPSWITFSDESGSAISTDMIDGDESSLRPRAIITVP